MGGGGRGLPVAGWAEKEECVEIVATFTTMIKHAQLLNADIC